MYRFSHNQINVIFESRERHSIDLSFGGMKSSIDGNSDKLTVAARRDRRDSQQKSREIFGHAGSHLWQPYAARPFR